MLNIRRSWNRLSFDMGTPILVIRHLDTEMAPRVYSLIPKYAWLQYYTNRTCHYSIHMIVASFSDVHVPRILRSSKPACPSRTSAAIVQVCVISNTPERPLIYVRIELRPINVYCTNNRYLTLFDSLYMCLNPFHWCSLCFLKQIAMYLHETPSFLMHHCPTSTYPISDISPAFP